MFPRSPENLLEDTKNVHRTLVVDKNAQKLIILLLIIVFVLGLGSVLKFFIPQPAKPVSQQGVQASEPTPVPQTGTFVDTLTGTVMYLKDNYLFEHQFPDRKTNQIVGLRPSERVSTFLPVSPVWSPSGRFLAVMADAGHVYVSEFDTGKFVGSFALRHSLSGDQVPILSFDPTNEVLVVGTHSATNPSQDSLLFYLLFTQKEMGYYPNCEANGIWLPTMGYLAKCQLAESKSINLISFEPTSTTMVPLTKEKSGLSYQLIGEYQTGKALAARTQNGKQDLVYIGVKGQVGPVPLTVLPKNVSISDVLDPKAALMRRISNELKIPQVRSVTVSDANDWLVYETPEGLFANTLDLKEKSYFIGQGTLPAIRPY